MALTKRITKGSALTATEHDANLDHFTAADTAEAAARDAADALRAPLTGATFSGAVSFSGTTHPGLKVLSLTTAQIAALSPAPGDGTVIYDTTLGKYVARLDGAWFNLVTSEDFPAESAATNRVWTQDTVGFYLATYPEFHAQVATGISTVTVTGTGEKDIAVTAAIGSIRITPTGGNMTIDDVTGLAYIGQSILVCLKQDTSNRTLALGGTTNCVLGDAAALTMPTGSGAVKHALLVACDNGAGTIVPTFYAV